MPSHSVEKVGQTTPQAEKEPTFAELQKQKEELFREIEGGSLKLMTKEKRDIVSLTTTHSIKDGFELAKGIGLEGYDFADSLGFAVKRNRSFMKRFVKFMRDNEQYIDQENREYVLAMSNSVDGITPYGWSIRTQTDLNKVKFAPKINKYYSHYIRNRRAKSPEQLPDRRTQVERVAEEHLLSAEAILEESYYTGPIREMFGVDKEIELEEAINASVETVRKHGMPDKEIPDVADLQALRGNTIDKKTVDRLLVSMLDADGKIIDPEDLLIQSKLKNARYAPSKVVFEERKRGAEKGLVEEIKNSLVKRGFKEENFDIEYDDFSHEYKVVQKTGLFEEIGREERGMEKVEKKEKFNAVYEIPTETRLEESDPNYRIYCDMREGRDEHRFNHFRLEDSKLHMINGKPVALYKDWYLNSFFVKSDGTMSDMYYHANGVHDVGGKLEFSFATDASMQSFNVMVGDKQFGDLDWNPVGYNFLVHNDKTYHVANLRGAVKEHFVSAIFKDNSKIFESDPGETIDNIFFVGDDLACITRGLNIRERKTIRLVEKSSLTDSYSKIVLCENSKDKLIYYAERGDQHFVRADYNELLVESGTEISKVLKIGDGLAILGIHPDENMRGKRFVMYSTDSIDDPLTVSSFSRGVDVTNFSEIDNNLFLIIRTPDGKAKIHWGDTTVNVPLKYDYNHSVGFGDKVFITDKDTVVVVKFGEDHFEDELVFKGGVEVVNSGGKLFIIESLKDKKRVWEYSEIGELKLNEHEQRDLDLANAVAKEDLETIKTYFRNYYVNESLQSSNMHIKGSLKNMLEQSQMFVNSVNQTIKEMPELFMDTLRAKNDKPTQQLMEQMFFYMFPEVQVNKERTLRMEIEKRKNSLGGLSGIFGGEGRSEKNSTFNYDQGINELQSIDESGYYEMMNANREVLKLREPLPPSTFITQGIFGNHTESGWTKVNVPLAQEVSDPAKETTFEFVDEKSTQTINLPRIAGAKIITERLKGVTSKDTEVPVQIIEENNLGEVRVDKGREAKHLTYSMSYSEAPKTMAEVTHRDYEKFKKDFERSFGDVMTRPIGAPGDDLDIFVHGLKDKSPREQVIAIQEFCYEYGYYNVDNKVRDTNNFEERLGIMEGRMSELKEKDPKLSHKLYAGICTDFATLTTGLLRKAGFVSGISTGFVPEAGSTVVKTDRAHAVSYVLWPNPENKDGKPDMIIVDGTPSSITPKIVELEKQAAEINTKSSVDAEKELIELERIIKTMDSESIKKLENGVLEKTLNHILYGIKQSHVDVMERVLNASRYAGFDILEMSRGNIADQIEFRKFLEEEIYKEKGAKHENRDRRGEELFELMQDFTKRFEKDQNVKGKQEALDVLEKVFDIAEKYLDPIEARSAASVLTYLRAKRMR